jgi:uncharacterized membrane protein
MNAHSGRAQGDAGARIAEVDALRGAAIVMMVAYHFIFDIWYLDVAGFDMFSLPLVLFQRTIGILFLLLVGVSLTLSESRNREGYAHHARRGLFLCAVALGITAATWIYPHEGFVTFGIIHLIALATFIAPAFFRLGRQNALIGLILIAAGLLVTDAEVQTPWLFWLGLTAPGYAALDFYPVLPWFGVVLIGVFAGQAVYPDGKSAFKAPRWAAFGMLESAGRHSLLIYLAHQPIIFGALLLFKAAAGA